MSRLAVAVTEGASIRHSFVLTNMSRESEYKTKTRLNVDLFWVRFVLSESFFVHVSVRSFSCFVLIFLSQSGTTGKNVLTALGDI